MPRLPRSFFQTNFFHVMTQGINKSYIFEEPVDIKFYIKSMYEIKEEHNIKIIAYCIMNNHTHMLIETQKIENMSKYMQRLNRKYASYYNYKYNRVGYVFRDRYKTEGIYGEKQLYSCIKYIFDNPVKAGICSYPFEYPFSNYKFSIYDKEAEEYIFIDTEKNEEELCDKIVEKYLRDNNINIEELKREEYLKKEIITILKRDYKISFEKISKKLELNRKTISRIYHK